MSFSLLFVLFVVTLSAVVVVVLSVVLVVASILVVVSLVIVVVSVAIVVVSKFTIQWSGESRKMVTLKKHFYHQIST